MISKNPIIMGFVLVLVLVVGLYLFISRESNEIMWVVNRMDKSPNISKIQDKAKIEEVQHILKDVKLLNDSFPIIKEPDYRFWIGQQNGTRTVNCDIWFNNSKAIIFDRKTGEYFLIQLRKAQKLKTILELEN